MIANPAVIAPLSDLLERYAVALEPWAKRTAYRMLMEVDARDRDRWRDLSEAMSDQMRYDIARAPVGVRMRQLLDEQVDLITSLPRKAAERVHEMALKGLVSSSRGAEIREAILRSADVTESRAVLIARTETQRTATALTQVRAEAAGTTHYIWHTAGDKDVRPGHKAMNGKTCSWAEPPAVQESDGIHYIHPGTIWNCRCWAEPVIDLMDVT